MHIITERFAVDPQSECAFRKAFARCRRLRRAAEHAGTEESRRRRLRDAWQFDAERWQNHSPVWRDRWLFLAEAVRIREQHHRGPTDCDASSIESLSAVDAFAFRSLRQSWMLTADCDPSLRISSADHSPTTTCQYDTPGPAQRRLYLVVWTETGSPHATFTYTGSFRLACRRIAEYTAASRARLIDARVTTWDIPNIREFSLFDGCAITPGAMQRELAVINRVLGRPQRPVGDPARDIATYRRMLDDYSECTAGEDAARYSDRWRELRVHRDDLYEEIFEFACAADLLDATADLQTADTDALLRGHHRYATTEFAWSNIGRAQRNRATTDPAGRCRHTDLTEVARSLQNCLRHSAPYLLTDDLRQPNGQNIFPVAIADRRHPRTCSPRPTRHRSSGLDHDRRA
ncbi:hypothetical protein [Nocardia aurantia]|uniref:Uncharacterized protein n=1 Tax=Nocardia aurantia TaxID=2585199 RepID=A0A7K0DT06_9NOCA|nr:hypothetical protein [Nocardia aurantia]MQY28903.1 hypothetical protein [Nocardia aurantia]